MFATQAQHASDCAQRVTAEGTNALVAAWSPGPRLPSHLTSPVCVPVCACVGLRGDFKGSLTLNPLGLILLMDQIHNMPSNIYLCD